MVAGRVKLGDRKNSSGATTPDFNVNVELDNKALRAKNKSLTQAVAKLQQEHGELQKQIRNLHGESFEVNSKYNNLKHVISAIDSTTKRCLPKLTEVVETFTGIIQMCAVAVNLSNTNKDTRTQAVKPHAVNGHVLQDPTITLSRLNDSLPYSPPRPSTSRVATNCVSPGTSRVVENRAEMEDSSDEEDNGNDENGDEENDDPEGDISFVSSMRRQRTRNKMDMSGFQEDDDDYNEDELDEQGEAEENDIEEYNQRLLTIREEEESELSPRSPNTARNQTVLSGRFQEVKIYLNKLSSSCIDEIRGSNNISISLSPPERRQSYKNRSSSLIGESNDSTLDTNFSILSEANGSPLSRTLRRLSKFNETSASPPNSPVKKRNEYNTDRREAIKGRRSYHNLSPNKSLSMRNSQSSDTLTESRADLDLGSGMCTVNVILDQSSMASISAIQNFQTPSVSENDCSSLNMSKSMAMLELGLVPSDYRPRTSTPKLRRSKRGESSSRSNSTDSPGSNKSVKRKSPVGRSTSNVTKRKTTRNSQVTKRTTKSNEQRKVAQVILKRLSLERRLSGSPIKKLADIVNVQNIRKKKPVRKLESSDSEEEERANLSRKEQKTPKAQKKASPKKNMKPEPKSPARRPKRSAQPKSLKEPSLTKRGIRKRLIYCPTCQNH